MYTGYTRLHKSSFNSIDEVKNAKEERRRAREVPSALLFHRRGAETKDTQPSIETPGTDEVLPLRLYLSGVLEVPLKVHVRVGICLMLYMDNVCMHCISVVCT